MQNASASPPPPIASTGRRLRGLSSPEAFPARSLRRLLQAGNESVPVTIDAGPNQQAIQQLLANASNGGDLTAALQDAGTLFTVRQTAKLYLCNKQSK